MKVGLFIDTYHPKINGVITSVESLKNGLEKLGHQVYIITGGSKKLPYEKNNIIYLPSLNIEYWNLRLINSFSQSNLDFLKKYNFDIIHSHTELTVGILANILSKEQGIPNIHTYHTMYDDYKYYVFNNVFGIGDFVEKFIVKNFCINNINQLIVPSQKIFDYLVTTYNLKRNPNIIKTGVDILNNDENISLNELKSKYEFINKDFIILYVGRIAKEKNIEFLIECQKVLSEKNKNIKLLIVGDGPYLSEIKKLVEKYKLNDHVKFTGKVLHENISNVYKISDICATSSMSETQGLSILESLSCGTPIMCINDSAFDYVLDDNINGLRFETKKDYINKIIELSLKYKGKLKIFDKENGGAGSARNIGLENATGEFIKFVDADDYLRLDVLEKMYNIAKEHNVSLVRGNYQTIVGPFKSEDKCSWSDIKGNQIVDVRKNKDYIITETPGIGNKLIDRNLIGDLRFPEHTKWEDLAIMPIVIASSEKLFHIDEPIYNYRVNMNTTIKDFIYKIPNILDIIKCVENIEKQMSIRGLSEEYRQQIESIYILHTLFRIENAMIWINFPHSKKEVVVSSLLGILDIKYPNWQENEIVKNYRIKNKLFDFDMNRLNKFANNEYRTVDIETAENNIKKVLIKN